MIQESEYKERRKRLADVMEENSIAVICSAKQKIRSNDTEYPYRQNSHFYYLTGFKEDNSCLMVIKEKKKSKSILFVLKKDATKELWTGKRLGEKEAKKKFAVDEVHTIDSLEKIFEENATHTNTLYFDFKTESATIESIKKISKTIQTYKNIAVEIERMRLIKSDAEITLIRKALSITKIAHHKAIQMKKTKRYEYEIQAKIENIFKKNGAYSDAYTSIVAGGNNANTLHYINNDKRLKKGELILIDAGCEYEYYASDITRTIPVSKKFSEAQKELYTMVLDVQLQIITMIKPNILRSDLQKKSEELLCDGMIALGILEGKKSKLLEEAKHKKYYPHGIGHWMGIDVHDQALYKDLNGEEIPLQAGMVLTIEPGIYCDASDLSIPKKFRGIGIRIEDNILVTNDGCENLSIGIVKNIEDIENLSA